MENVVFIISGQGRLDLQSECWKSLVCRYGVSVSYPSNITEGCFCKAPVIGVLESGSRFAACEITKGDAVFKTETKYDQVEEHLTSLLRMLEVKS